jgi:hypothetical protein
MNNSFKPFQMLLLFDNCLLALIEGSFGIGKNDFVLIVFLFEQCDFFVFFGEKILKLMYHLGGLFLLFGLFLFKFFIVLDHELEVVLELGDIFHGFFKGQFLFLDFVNGHLLALVKIESFWGIHFSYFNEFQILF